MIQVNVVGSGNLFLYFQSATHKKAGKSPKQKVPVKAKVVEPEDSSADDSAEVHLCICRTFLKEFFTLVFFSVYMQMYNKFEKKSYFIYIFHTPQVQTI